MTVQMVLEELTKNRTGFIYNFLEGNIHVSAKFLYASKLLMKLEDSDTEIDLRDDSKRSKNIYYAHRFVFLMKDTVQFCYYRSSSFEIKTMSGTLTLKFEKTKMKTSASTSRLRKLNKRPGH